MEHRTWCTIDKASWGPGPWQNEPDKEQWPDPATGLACLAKRGPHGGLCGYVGVPAGHPWYGKDQYEIPGVPGVREITYTDLCEDGPEEGTICHVPGPGEPEPLWWVGFHCGHAWDFEPGRDYGPAVLAAYRQSGMDFEYRTVGYVKDMCAALAAQAAKAHENSPESGDRQHVDEPASRPGGQPCGQKPVPARGADHSPGDEGSEDQEQQPQDGEQDDDGGLHAGTPATSIPQVRGPTTLSAARCLRCEDALVRGAVMPGEPPEGALL